MRTRGCVCSDRKYSWLSLKNCDKSVWGRGFSWESGCVQCCACVYVCPSNLWGSAGLSGSSDPLPPWWYCRCCRKLPEIRPEPRKESSMVLLAPNLHQLPSSFYGSKTKRYATAGATLASSLTMLVTSLSTVPGSSTIFVAILRILTSWKSPIN